MDNKDMRPSEQAMDDKKSYTLTLEEYLKVTEPIYRQQQAVTERCINGLTEYASSLAASGQDDQLPWLCGLVESIAVFHGLEESLEQYLTAYDRMTSEARNSGQAALSEQSKTDILIGLKQYTDEMQIDAEDFGSWFIECTEFMNKLQEQWQSIGQEESGTEMGGKKSYTLDEYLKMMEPVYQQQQAVTERCIHGLTEYAASLAAAGQDDQLPWLRHLIEDIAEFHGLEASEQYLTEFDRMVSEAHSSGQAVLSEESKTDILAGLKQYTDEMLDNEENHEPWFIECAEFMNKLREQWQSIGPEESGTEMGGMTLG